MTGPANSVKLVARNLGAGRSFSQHQFNRTYTSRVLSVRHGSIELVVAGIRVQAKTQLPFSVGDTLVLRLLRGRNGQIRLQILQKESVDPLVGRAVPELGLGHLHGAEAVVATLLRSDRGIGGTLLKRIARRIGRTKEEKKPTETELRAATEVEDRMLSAAPGYGIDIWNGHGSDPNPDNSDRTEQGDDRWEPDLRSYLIRTVAEPHEPVQLFNAVRSTGYLHWIVIPVSAVGGDQTVSGCLRLGINPVSGHSQVVVFDVGPQVRRLWVRIDLKKKRVRWGVDGQPFHEGPIDHFRVGLESIFQTFDTKKSEEIRFDGADDIGAEEMMRGVDRFG